MSYVLYHGVLGSTEGDEFLLVYRSPAVDVYAADGVGGGGDAALVVDLDLGAVVGDAPARPLRIELFGGPAAADGDAGRAFRSSSSSQLMARACALRGNQVGTWTKNEGGCGQTVDTGTRPPHS